MINRKVNEIVLIAIFILLSNLAFAQERVLTNDSDTAFWFHQRARLNAELGLPTIDKTPEIFELRFWDDSKVVRLWGPKDSLQSEVIYFLRQYTKVDAYNKYDQGKFYFKKTPLNRQTIQAIEYLMADFGIEQISTDKLIKGWPVGNDGHSFIIESCNVDSFSFKNYWSPGLWNKQSRLIKYFFTQLNSLEEIQDGSKELMHKNPFGIYYRGIGSTKLKFSSFFSRWYFRVDRFLFRKARDRKNYRKKAAAKKEAEDK